MITGKQAEQMFYHLMKDECKEIRLATKEEDMFSHFDIVCDGIKYDVKTQKKLNRYDDESSNVLWIEIINVRGNKGWLIGEADKIAFLINNEFLIVDRRLLFEEIKKQIPNHNPLSYKWYKKWYRRRGRKDKVTFIYPKDIEHIIEKRFAFGETTHFF